MHNLRTTLSVLWSIRHHCQNTHRVVAVRTWPNITSRSIIDLTQHHFRQDNRPTRVPTCSKLIRILLFRKTGPRTTYLMADDDEYIPAPNLPSSKSTLEYTRQQTYDPEGFARLTLKDVLKIEQRAQLTEEQSCVFPAAPKVQDWRVPWYLNTSFPTRLLRRV